MKKQFLLFLIVIIPLVSFSQTKFRSGIFLHHSTGENIWGPNGSATSVPIEISRYNTSHGYSGQNAISMNQSMWPETPWDNSWERWHRIFENKDLIDADIRNILLTNKIVVVKSCFPSSAMTGLGLPSDTTTPQVQSMYNYKWHWRHIIRIMEKHPENFFAIWTNAPLVSGISTLNEADMSKKFCKWAKDTLAKGLDPIIKTFPKNIYVFDFFSKLTDNNGFLRSQYAVSSGDSHPNSSATALVAPQFVNEIFDAAITYESILLDIGENVSTNFVIYPNPAKENITIKANQSEGDWILTIYNSLGQVLIRKPVGDYETNVNIESLEKGIYYIKYSNGKLKVVKKFLKN